MLLIDKLKAQSLSLHASQKVSPGDSPLGTALAMSCIVLRYLKNVKWDSSGKKFARSPDNGHYDLVDALIYLIRHIVYSKNPYPAHYDLNLRREDMFVSNPNNYYSKSKGLDVQNFYKILNVKTKKR